MTRPDAVAEPKTVVLPITQTDSSVLFHVGRVGSPVEVKVPYFPNWAATGAEGPYRVAPNLMVVVPTSHQVTLTYGSSGATAGGGGSSRWRRWWAAGVGGGRRRTSGRGDAGGQPPVRRPAR